MTGEIKSLRITSACLLSLFLFQGNFPSTSTSLGARLFRERPNSDVVSLFTCTFNTPSSHIASNSENKLYCSDLFREVYVGKYLLLKVIYILKPAGLTIEG